MLAADLRQTAREIFLHALKQSSVEQAFARDVQYERGVLRVCEDLFDLDSFPRIVVISFGKAAHTMAAALAGQVGPLATGIIVAPEASLEGHSQLPGFRYFTAGHPVPNAESVRAAEAALKAVSSTSQRALVVYLVSGGGSSLLERPVDAEISLDDLVTTYRVLVDCGAPITQINAVRKHLSAVKGGRLAKAAGANSQQVSIMISDVPENALDSLASGPTMPDSTSVEECYAIAGEYRLLERFPKTVIELFKLRALEETPKKDDPVFRNARWWPIVSNASAVQAAAEKAAQLGFAVEIDNSSDDWDYAKAADYLLGKVRKLRRGVSRVCLVSGGEVTVKLPEKAGSGGRNQQFALYCASKIVSENITVLSAGTDGIDGNSPSAGAVADGSTLLRHSSRGTSETLNDVLKRFNAYPFFDSLGDAIIVGPTGNNLRDLRILLAT